MKIFQRRILLSFLLCFMVTGMLYSMKAEPSTGSKKLDLDYYHNVGNIWLRVSNFGFFGSGDDAVPQFPSLEYPGGSGIDYLYQGALWFGAKKKRRNESGKLLYWKDKNMSETITDTDELWNPALTVVVDTLTSVGFDGDADQYEFLPAFNPLETSAIGSKYGIYNSTDNVVTTSIRNHRKGVDDDGDGKIDEDPVGYGFPFRLADELPDGLGIFSGRKLSDPDIDPIKAMEAIESNSDLWFPLGFVDLSGNTDDGNFTFSRPLDDDTDGLVDEDGYPVSEQDFIGYYYDYSPFGTSGERDWGSSKGSFDHHPLNIRVRQMSYQWSYEYIKNLVYIEFNITNMNAVDTLFDCAMGVYIDADVGPQSWDGDKRSLDDLSGYVKGKGFEFAYTYDEDKDNGLTNGLIGVRVCSPNPDEMDFACWYWNRGKGPDDKDPYKGTSAGIFNEKYALLSGKNPRSGDDYVSLKDVELQDEAADTRFLFAFYGDQQGLTAPGDSTWNLAPKKTMKIIIAMFPGENLEDLKATSTWAMKVYGQPQGLQEVILPDLVSHYNPPEPPEIPGMYAKMDASGDEINVFWDNRSEFFIDKMTVDAEVVGWQGANSNLPSHENFWSGEDWKTDIWNNYPDNYKDDSWDNRNALIDPWTAHRLNHDFQGYAVYFRSGKGSNEYWQPSAKYDKIDTEQDLLDYDIVIDNEDANFADYGGELGRDEGLPIRYDSDGNQLLATDADTLYYHFNKYYELVPYAIDDVVYGEPIFNTLDDANLIQSYSDYFESLETGASNIGTKPPTWNDNYTVFENGSLIFKNENIDADVYFGLIGDDEHAGNSLQKLIPIYGHLGQNKIGDSDTDKSRKARRYYNETIFYPQKGVELYVAVTAFDRGMPSRSLGPQESGRDESANMKVLFPGPKSDQSMDNIYVVPNPYKSLSDFDGKRENDTKGDKSRRIWFVNLPEDCTIRIYTLAGDLVDEIEHNGSYSDDVISPSKAAQFGMTSSGIHSWDLLSKYNQIVVSGLYLFSVENNDNGDIKVGKFVIIR